MNKLRVYYTHHTNFNFNTKKFKQTKCFRDFDGVSEADATRTLLDELGAREDSIEKGSNGQAIQVRDFAEIKGSGVVDPERPKSELDQWQAHDSMLFTPEMAKATLSDAPNMRKRHK